MKKKLTNYLVAFLAIVCLSFSSLAQEDGGNGNGNPCNWNFNQTANFCFTNSSDHTVDNIPLSILGCDYEVCVKIKPKPGCFTGCAYQPTPNGYFSEDCNTVSVGNTICFAIPTTHNPMTDCWDIDITMKVVSQSITMNANLEDDFPVSGTYKQIHDHCLEDETWYSRMIRTSGTGNNFNFNIITIGIPGTGE
jgi:hypothetical protein